MPVRVLIAVGETVYRAGLRTLLEKDRGILVVGEAEHGAAVIKARRLWETDVLLLGTGLPGHPTPRGIVRMLQGTPRTHILVIAMLEDRWDAAQTLLDLGARGCISKDSNEEVLIGAVRAVAAGERYLDPARTVPRGEEGGSPVGEGGGIESDGHPATQLTAFEVDLCKLLVSGFTHLEIAERLGLSESGVETHRDEIMAKLGLRSRADLVHFAQAHRLWKAW